MKRPLAVLLLLAAAVVGLTACGQSSQDKAKSQVCDARADISKQVNELKGLTLSTATVDGVKKNVQAIQDDLGKIKDAQGNLNADRKKQVQARQRGVHAAGEVDRVQRRQEPVAVGRRHAAEDRGLAARRELPADAREGRLQLVAARPGRLVRRGSRRHGAGGSSAYSGWPSWTSQRAELAVHGLGADELLVGQLELGRGAARTGTTASPPMPPCEPTSSSNAATSSRSAQ